MAQNPKAQGQEKSAENNDESTSGSQSIDVSSEVDKVVGSLIPAKGRKNIANQLERIVLRATKEERFSGPMPHPKHLREYEDILHGFADRTLTMAEKAQDSFIADMKCNRIYEFSGLVLGFLALLSLVIGAFATAYFGHEVVAGAFLGAAAFGAVAQFIIGRVQTKKPDAKAKSDK